LTDPATGLTDSEELLSYIRSAVLYLTSRYQLMHFLRINRRLVVTAADVESYNIPDHYGFIAPINTRESGLICNTLAGDEPTNLEYLDLARFAILRRTTTGRPTQFTMAASVLYLTPVPDDAYVIESIEKATQFDSEGAEIPTPYVAMVSAFALLRMSSDQGRANPLLGQEVSQLVQAVVNGEARQKVRFYTSRERVGSWGTRRSGR
jgi:hypothetical protein